MGAGLKRCATSLPGQGFIDFQHDHPCLLVQFLDVLVSGNLLLHVPFMQAAQLGAGVVTGTVQYVGMPGKNMVADFRYWAMVWAE